MKTFLLFVGFALSAAAPSGKPCLRKPRGDTVDCVCDERYCDTLELPDAIEEGALFVYTSSASGERFDLERSSIVSAFDGYGDAFVNVSSAGVNQEILGFGGALTDATGFNLESLTEPVREKLLDSYFGRSGIEYSLLRVPIGGTDFSPRKYTNADCSPTDDERPRLEGIMTLQPEDCGYKIPYIQRILEKNGKIKLFVSSWSAPHWMLAKDKFARNIIHPDYYKDWAEYHLRFLDLYKSNNITFWGLTGGNEIVVGVFSLTWNMENYQKWINDHLGPLMRDSQHRDLKLLALDDQTTYLVPWMNILLDNTTRSYVDGFATHWYLDSKIYLHHSAYRSLFPDKLIVSTEASICKYEVGFEEKTQWYGAELYAENIITKMNYFTNGWVDWNLALDVEGGPNNENNYCEAPVIVNGEANEFYKRPIFYAMGHFSKFVTPGSRQVTSSVAPYDRNLHAVAFKVEDSPWNFAVVVLNRNDAVRRVSVCVDGTDCAFIQAPARSITTAIGNLRAWR